VGGPLNAVRIDHLRRGVPKERGVSRSGPATNGARWAPPMDAAAIAVRDLRTTYGRTHAVRGVSFEVRRGEIFAVVGPNGAGKTTTIEILEGYRKQSSGDVWVLSADPGRRGAGASESASCSRSASSTRS
jgi:ABC-type glutathione transport system ATPase component